MWTANILGLLKIMTLVFISITGLVVLGGHVPRVPRPGANFHNAFQGTTTNGNDLSSALVSIVFAYSGFSNAFNLVNEIKDPIPSLKRHGICSVVVVSVLFVLCNVAYFSAVDKSTFAQSKEIAAGVFFATVFGSGGSAETALNVLVLLSAYGNLLASLIGHSRMIREIGRQGVLPCTDLWVTTRPFGTPIGPYALKWLMTFVMIVAPPAGDAFQFVVSLQTYPEAMFGLALTLGVYIIRRRRRRNQLPRSQFRVCDVLLLFYNLVQVLLLVMPWLPPKGGPYAGNVSFWYATYCVTGIAILLVCALYYIAWMHVLPHWLKYRIRAQVIKAEDDSVVSHKLIKVPLVDVDRWDAEHDEAGQLRARPAAAEDQTTSLEFDLSGHKTG
ncbi:hypothetical protein E4U55_006061 [Claviceps digitariae]|nr:hypothetical protein E4U55_006061 [Claviceps digitariae]